MSYNIQIKIINGEDFKGGDLSGKSDPFVEVKCGSGKILQLFFIYITKINII